MISTGEHEAAHVIIAAAAGVPVWSAEVTPASERAAALEAGKREAGCVHAALNRVAGPTICAAGMAAVRIIDGVMFDQA